MALQPSTSTKPSSATSPVVPADAAGLSGFDSRSYKEDPKFVFVCGCMCVCVSVLFSVPIPNRSDDSLIYVTYAINNLFVAPLTKHKLTHTHAHISFPKHGAALACRVSSKGYDDAFFCC